MPYIVISTEDIEKGPSILLDEQQDEKLKESMGFRYASEFPNTIRGPPIIVLNRAEDNGYRVISTVVKGNSIIWTLHKEKAA